MARIPNTAGKKVTFDLEGPLRLAAMRRIEDLGMKMGEYLRYLVRRDLATGGNTFIHHELTSEDLTQIAHHGLSMAAETPPPYITEKPSRA